MSFDPTIHRSIILRSAAAAALGLASAATLGCADTCSGCHFGQFDCIATAQDPGTDPYRIELGACYPFADLGPSLTWANNICADQCADDPECAVAVAADVEDRECGHDTGGPVGSDEDSGPMSSGGEATGAGDEIGDDGGGGSGGFPLDLEVDIPPMDCGEGEGHYYCFGAASEGEGYNCHPEAKGAFYLGCAPTDLVPGVDAEWLDMFSECESQIVPEPEMGGCGGFRPSISVVLDCENVAMEC